MNKLATDVTIEQLTQFFEEEAEAIRDLVSQLGSTSQPLSNHDLKDMLKSPTTCLLVAREPKKQKIVGMATLAVYRIPYLRKAYLDDFIIDDKYHGQGIGSLLMQTVLEQAKKSGAVYIEFTSNPKRIAANKFYQKMGFEKRETNVYRLTLNHGKT